MIFVVVYVSYILTSVVLVIHVRMNESETYAGLVKVVLPLP